MKESFGNSQYFHSLNNDTFGVKIFLEPRPKCHNHPLYIRLSGTFFRYAFSYVFVDALLKMLHGLEIKWNPVRFDASVDFISYEEIFIPHPSVVVRPGILPKMKKESLIITFPDGSSDEVLDGYKAGYGGDCALRIYNKLTDEHDTEFLKRHTEYEGCSGVWRLEFQLRGDTLKAVFANSRESFISYDAVYAETLGQCFRRYNFQGFEYPKSEISSYIKRIKTDEGTYKSWQSKLKGLFHKVLQLEAQMFNKSERYRSFETFRVFDFFDEKEKEGSNNVE